jgi:PDZ domain/Aspartyl protease
MLRKIVCFFILWLIFINALLAQNLGFSLIDGQKHVQIPIEIHDNLIIIPVILNGRLPLKFVLDTGVRTTILTDKTLTDILGLTYAKKYTMSVPGGDRKVDAYITNDVSLDIPGVHGEGHSMMVLAEDFLNLRSYLGTEVSGILGYELFSRFVVKVNYKRKVLELMKTTRFKAGRKYQVLPISIEDTKPYLIAEVQVNDTARIKVKLLVDTGASHGLILDPESDPQIKVPARSIHSIIGQGLGGVIRGQIARINSLNLGIYKIPDVIANFPDANSYMDSLRSSLTIFRNGTIGGDVLSRFTIVFDFPNEKMYFKKNSFFSKKFYLNLSGITVKADGPFLKTYIVTDVRNGSVAEVADLRRGDTILYINSVNAEELSLNNVIGLFNSSPGKKVTLVIERGGVKFYKEFVLQNQI